MIQSNLNYLKNYTHVRYLNTTTVSLAVINHRPVSEINPVAEVHAFMVGCTIFWTHASGFQM